ncbi:hypothetical protein [Nocardia paucivorans]|uniref:hypothetical protein n=1 Tax=Nocardia paucivorans TaxID=114259 RepID=UPI0002F5D863|nr:hypothetical protein [Nocardia paucivorans]
MTARALSIVRVHTGAWPFLIAWPLGILLIAFLIPWTIFTLDPVENAETVGSVYSTFGMISAFYITAMTQTFPFALGLGVTRRDYFAATLLCGAAQVLGFTVLLWVLSVIEGATDGWGVGMVMFGLQAKLTDNALLQLGGIAAMITVVVGLGLLIGAVHQRWRAVGLYTMFTGVLVVGGSAAILITWQQWWPEIGRWFADTPRVVPMVVLPAVIALATVASSWMVLRRATV